jgi:hypothetical protein
MRMLLLPLLVLAAAACGGADDSSAAPGAAQGEAAAEAGVTARELPDSAVRHVVVFKYRPEATAEQIAEVTTAFRALKDRIPGVLAFEHGVNNSPEGKNLGFTHAYTLAFESAAARDAYLPHPEHRAFGELLGRLGVLEDAFVVDYVPAP